MDVALRLRWKFSDNVEVLLRMRGPNPHNFVYFTYIIKYNFFNFNIFNICNTINFCYTSNFDISKIFHQNTLLLKFINYDKIYYYSLLLLKYCTTFPLYVNEGWGTTMYSSITNNTVK